MRSTYHLPIIFFCCWFVLYPNELNGTHWIRQKEYSSDKPLYVQHDFADDLMWQGALFCLLCPLRSLLLDLLRPSVQSKHCLNNSLNSSLLIFTNLPSIISCYAQMSSP